MSRRNETCLFHARLSTTRIHNGHQTTTVTTTSHRSRENDYFFGPTGNFGNGHQNKARYCEINIGDVCGEPVSDVSTNGPNFRVDRSVLITGFYATHYIVGMFITCVPNEARYSVISVCNEF
jgi:hypothetical protein